MPIAAAIIALAVIVWGAVYAQRGSLLVGCGFLLIVGYVLGYEFWNAQIGPLPVTLDRLLLVAMFAAAALQWRLGKLAFRPLTAGDLALGVLLAVIIVSALFSGHPEFIAGLTSKWGRLLTSFLIPAALFFLIRQIPVTRPEWLRMNAALVLLGVFLAVTGVLEVLGKWPLVFPRYIADPSVGTHFGRARGPELNAVSLGLYITASFWCAWTLAKITFKRWQQLVCLMSLPAMAAGIFFTYTRSTWLGLAASGLVVAAIEIPRRWRLPALAATATVGLLVIAASWSQLAGIQREGTAAESSHSVDQRASFAYVSWQMFCDHPVFGVGFGRFYDQKMPYLSDRSQNFELESLRSLHHHNTFLCILTETGLVGLAAFIVTLLVWARCAWHLSRQNGLSLWIRAQGTLMLALLTNYLASALFHDLTLIPSQQVLLFAFAGLTVNLRQQTATCSRPANEWHGGRLLHTPDADSKRAAHVELFGMKISRVTMHETVQQVIAWCGNPRGTSCKYIVTPNVDHAVLFQRQADFRQAYSDASFVLADGAPIVLASHLLRRALPERVAGSDLIPQLFLSATAPIRVFLLGAAPGVAKTAASRIVRQWPNVQIVGTYSPPLGFENDSQENARILTCVAAAGPDLLIVGFGAPKQELWVHAHRHELKAKVAICAGATIDFLAGHRHRSPVWMRRTGLEWLHRVATEPQRLAARYARDAWVFPQLVWREWRQQRV